MDIRASLVTIAVMVESSANAHASTIIAPSTAWRLPDLAELWRHRDLVWFLARRDLKVRYQQTVLGVAWALLQPLALAAVLAVCFRASGIAPDAPGGVPYWLHAWAGLLPWLVLAHALNHGSACLIEHQRLLTKVYFARLALPLASVATAAVDLTVASIALIIVLIACGHPPAIGLLLLPAAALLALAASFAVTVWLSAFNALYRDFRFAIPLLTQAWLLATPLAYPTSVIPPRWLPVYALNPLVGVVDAFRWCLLGSAPALGTVSTAILVTCVLLVTGLVAFRRLESRFADAL